jgi:hypothetical protein
VDEPRSGDVSITSPRLSPSTVPGEPIDDGTERLRVNALSRLQAAIKRNQAQVQFEKEKEKTNAAIVLQTAIRNKNTLNFVKRFTDRLKEKDVEKKNSAAILIQNAIRNKNAINTFASKYVGRIKENVEAKQAATNTIGQALIRRQAQQTYQGELQQNRAVSILQQALLRRQAQDNYKAQLKDENDMKVARDALGQVLLRRQAQENYKSLLQKEKDIEAEKQAEEKRKKRQQLLDEFILKRNQRDPKSFISSMRNIFSSKEDIAKKEAVLLLQKLYKQRKGKEEEERRRKEKEQRVVLERKQSIMRKKEEELKRKLDVMEAEDRMKKAIEEARKEAAERERQLAAEVAKKAKEPRQPKKVKEPEITMVLPTSYTNEELDNMTDAEFNALYRQLPKTAEGELNTPVFNRAEKDIKNAYERRQRKKINAADLAQIEKDFEKKKKSFIKEIKDKHDRFPPVITTFLSPDYKTRYINDIKQDIKINQDSYDKELKTLKELQKKNENAKVYSSINNKREKEQELSVLNYQLEVEFYKKRLAKIK